MHPLLPSTLLLLALAAGCLAPGPATVAPPHLGDVAHYAGDDGALLTVTAARLADRSDGWLRPHPSLVLAFDYRLPPYPGVHSDTFHFEEAVGLDGRTVQMVATCGLPGGDQSTIRCLDGRAKLLFGTAGLPGTFDAGLLWTNRPASAAPARIPWEFQPGDAVLATPGAPIAFLAEPVQHEGAACTQVRTAAPTPTKGQLLLLPWTVLDGPSLFCPTRSPSFPVQFRTQQEPGYHGQHRGPVTYNLTSFEPGGGTEVPFHSGPAWPRVDAPPAWSGPPYYVGDLGDEPGGFTLREAHQQAMTLNASYRAIMQADPPGLVTEFFQQETHHIGATAGTGQSEYQAVVAALAPDGHGVQVTLTKAVTTAAPGLAAPPTYALLSADPVQRPVPRVVPNQVHDAGRLTAVAAALDGNLTRYGGNLYLRHRADILNDRWAGTPESYDHTNGYQLMVLFAPPSGALFPYTLVLDGPSGAVVEADVAAGRLPV